MLMALPSASWGWYSRLQWHVSQLHELWQHAVMLVVDLNLASVVRHSPFQSHEVICQVVQCVHALDDHYLCVLHELSPIPQTYYYYSIIIKPLPVSCI